MIIRKNEGASIIPEARFEIWLSVEQVKALLEDLELPLGPPNNLGDCFSLVEMLKKLKDPVIIKY